MPVNSSRRLPLRLWEGNSSRQRQGPTSRDGLSGVPTILTRCSKDRIAVDSAVERRQLATSLYGPCWPVAPFRLVAATGSLPSAEAQVMLAATAESGGRARLGETTPQSAPPSPM